MRYPPIRAREEPAPEPTPPRPAPAPTDGGAATSFGHRFGQYAILPSEGAPLTGQEDPSAHSQASLLDKVQMGLTAAGMVPVVGEFANAASGVVSLAQGDWGGAALSLGAMVPGVGEAADVAKEARLANKVIHGGEKAAHVLQGGEHILRGEHAAQEATSAEHALAGAGPHEPGHGGGGRRQGGDGGGRGEDSGGRSGGPEPGNEAHNAARYEEMKRGLRQDMGKPAARDPELQRIMDDNYRANAQVGSGSTAAAIRHEAATGAQVGGRSHALKGSEQITRLERWLQNNPTASPGDRAAAENVIKDLRDALGR